MTDVKTVKGVIDKIDRSTFERNGETKHRWVLLIGGLRVSGFKEVPEPLEKAYKLGEEVNVSYIVKGKFMNYVNMSGTGMLKTKPKTDDSGFRSGGEVGALSIQNLVEANAGTMSQCIGAATSLWNRTKGLEDCASIEDIRTTATALFIEVNKDLNHLHPSRRLELKGLK